MKSQKALLEEEKRAIKALSDNIKATFNSKISYCSEKKKVLSLVVMYHCSDKVEQFWKESINQFENLMQEINDNKADASNTGKKQKENSIGENDTNIRWCTHLDELTECYNRIREEYLYRLPQHQPCNKLFNELKREIQKAMDMERPAKKFDIGRHSFRYIPKMIDLRNPDVIELLPYLMTAYVFNYRKNRFFYRFFYEKSSLISQIYENENFSINSAEAPRYRERIDELCRIFTLENITNKKLICHSDDNRPKVNGSPVRYYMKEFPHIKYRAGLNIVFAQWCRAIQGSAAKLGYSEISLKRDFEDATALYHYYIDRLEPTSN